MEMGEADLLGRIEVLEEESLFLQEKLEDAELRAEAAENQVFELEQQLADARVTIAEQEQIAQRQMDYIWALEDELENLLRERPEGDAEEV